MRETWNLIVDEAPEVTYYRKLFAKNFPDVILRLFNVLPCGNDHPNTVSWSLSAMANSHGCSTATRNAR